jgi:hypothetical protein
VIDTLTECFAALSQNRSDAYLESFESDDDESSLADLVDSHDYGSEKEDEASWSGRSSVLRRGLFVLVL